jgi:hypothetical protein
VAPPDAAAADSRSHDGIDSGRDWKRCGESPARAAAAAERRGTIEIALIGGARVHFDANVNEAALKWVLSALKATT